MATRPHPIAQYLPAEARAEAARQTYEYRMGVLRCMYPHPRTSPTPHRTDCCPLGVALRFMGRNDVAAPTVTVIANYLHRMQPTERAAAAGWGEIYRAVMSFVKGWDGDLISPATLAAELGVEQIRER